MIERTTPRAQADSPYDILAGSGLLLWYDLWTLANRQAYNTAVASLDSLAGTFPVAQATPSAQPTLAQCSAGRPCLLLDGGDSLVSATSFTVSQPYTAYVVIAPSAVASSTRPFGVGTSDPTRLLFILGSATSVTLNAGANLSVSGLPSVIGLNLWTLEVNGGASRIYRNGVAIGAGPGNAGTNSLNGPVRIGAVINQWMVGNFFAAALHSGARNADVERALCELTGVSYAG